MREKDFRGIWLLWLAMILLPGGVLAQQQTQEVPDAPSTVKPPQQFPTTAPAPSRPAQEAPADAGPAHNPPPPTTVPESDEDSVGQPAEAAPTMPPVRTVPQGSVPADASGSGSDLYTVTKNVNFVLVPVTVKDQDGRLVAGLLPKDFRVVEDGAAQKLSFFTSDPFPLSAAVILDLGMSDVAVQKVNKTFPSLAGAFSQFDEVSVYTYSSSASRTTDFTAANQRLTAVLNQMKTVTGNNNGVPVTSGPLAAPPQVNGRPIDSGVQPVYTPPKVSRVLNDAILMAAVDLSKRDRTRRKIIFIISDGREFGSRASYADVLKVLLSNNITVYGVGVEGAAIPVYGKLQRLTHLPRFGYSDILPKYSNATGGEIFNELSSADIDRVYAAAFGEARNQYTLGYATRSTPSSKYRQIEVLVSRPGCKTSDVRPCVNVTAKDGYYPLPGTQ